MYKQFYNIVVLNKLKKTIELTSRNKKWKKRSKTPLSVSTISDFVIDGQLKDIRLYTEGHLNEAHLWKPPEEAYHNPWESANKPHILMRPAHVFNKENVNERHINEMSDKLLDFSLSTSVAVNKNRIYPTPNSKNKKDVYIEELKLPDILIANKPKKEVTEKVKKSFEYFGPQQSKLPKIQKDYTNAFGDLPSDVDLAFKILHDPLSGATKKEKLKNLKKFEENVIQKSDLTNTNVLNDTKKVKELESQLEENLEKLSFSNNGANFHRLQVFSSSFDKIILEKNIFEDILSDIKKEYDDYLYYLLDKHSVNNGVELRQQAEITKSSTIRRTNEIKKLTKENEDLERLIIEINKKSAEVKQKIEDEEKFYLEQSNEEKNNQFMSESSLTVSSTGPKVQSTSIGDKIDTVKNAIVKKIKKLTKLNEKLNTDYVPNVVINNLTQSVKDTEVEIQKLIKQSEFLNKQIDESEDELRNLLMSFDKTEFAPENVEFLLKSLKSLDVLQLNNTTKSESKNETTTNSKQEKLDTAESSQKFYDDYFS